MTPEEREARTAAYWKNALAGADPEHWEAILKKDIPMSAGRGNLLYGFTDDELDRALLDDPQVGEGGTPRALRDRPAGQPSNTLPAMRRSAYLEAAQREVLQQAVSPAKAARCDSLRLF